MRATAVQFLPITESEQAVVLQTMDSKNREKLLCNLVLFGLVPGQDFFQIGRLYEVTMTKGKLDVQAVPRETA
jgi:hypothetical protein